MANPPLPSPQTDPTAISEHFRGSHGTELFVCRNSESLRRGNDQDKE